jgi:integrase/recombinase XerD
MLTIYRRHLKECSHRSRRYRRCRCPIHVEGSLGAKTIRKALDLTSWEAAENLIHEWNTTGRIGGRLAKTSSVEEAVKLYIADAVARKLSTGSINRYRAFLERVLMPWCTKERIAEVRELTFERVTSFRVSWTTWSSYTSAKNLELLRMFLRFCMRAGWIEENPAEDLRSPKIQMAPTLPFTEEEERRILLACDQYRTHNRHGKRSPERLRSFVLALRYTGLRIGDVATLETKRLEGNSILLYTHKTGVPVYVPIPEFVADALRQQARLNSNSAYFFWTGESKVKCVTVLWQRSLGTLFKKADVEGGHAHRYRDTFAVSLLLAGVSLEDVAVLLGHATPAITAKHYSPWVQARRARLEEMVSRTWSEPPRRLQLVAK